MNYLPPKRPTNLHKLLPLFAFVLVFLLSYFSLFLFCFWIFALHLEYLKLISFWEAASLRFRQSREFDLFELDYLRGLPSAYYLVPVLW